MVVTKTEETLGKADDHVWLSRCGRWRCRAGCGANMQYKYRTPGLTRTRARKLSNMLLSCSGVREHVPK